MWSDMGSLPYRVGSSDKLRTGYRKWDIVDREIKSISKMIAVISRRIFAVAGALDTGLTHP
jgi:hypothetical protein